MKSLNEGILLNSPINMLLAELEDETFNTAYTMWAVNTNSAKLDATNLSDSEANDLIKLLNEYSAKYNLDQDIVYVKFILKNQRFGKRFRNYFIQKHSIDLVIERLIFLLDQEAFKLLFQQRFELNPLLYTRENILVLLQEIANNLSLELDFVVSTYLDLNPQDLYLFPEYLNIPKENEEL